MPPWVWGSILFISFSSDIQLASYVGQILPACRDYYPQSVIKCVCVCVLHFLHCSLTLDNWSDYMITAENVDN